MIPFRYVTVTESCVSLHSRGDKTSDRIQIPYNCQQNLGLVIKRSSVYTMLSASADVLCLLLYVVSLVAKDVMVSQ